MEIQNIPQQLILQRRWVCWRYENRNGERTKMPYQAGGAYEARSNAPQTWSNFQQAYETQDIEGIGFMLGHGYCGFDFDNVIDETTWNFDAIRWVCQLNSYSEISPSGKGIKVILRGTLPDFFLDNRKTGRNLRGIPRKEMAVEAYKKHRFFTVTGNLLGGMKALRENQNGIDTVCEDLLHKWNATRAPKQHKPQRSYSEKLSDEDVLEKIALSRQAGKFQMLWNGHIFGYSSHSEADAALCSILNYWCNNDAPQVERLFYRSKLGERGKWQDREDYRNRTVQNMRGNA